MKLYILYHTNDEFARGVDEFELECKNHTEQEIEKVDIDAIEGSSVARLYDVVSYPAVLVVSEDGQLIKGWQGPMLPTVEEAIANLNS